MGAIALLAAVAVGLSAQVTAEFWHAMGGKNGGTTQAIANRFNASQPQYRVTAVYKGSDPDTMNAGIAAFRAGSPPAILQVYKIGTAAMMAAKGAVKPVFQLMKEQGEPFDSPATGPPGSSWKTSAPGTTCPTARRATASTGWTPSSPSTDRST